MATLIVPTILAHTPAEYAQQLALVRPFARRLHVDITDGDFADPRTIGLGQVYGAAKAARRTPWEPPSPCIPI
jgi:pentose-5-phosphate-3-epimerase